MANIKELKKKIKSTKGTFKITKAMKLVSAAKLSKAQIRILGLRPYSTELEGTVRTVSALAQNYTNEYFLPKNNKQAVVLVVSSDKGLCGGMNTNVLRALTNTMKELDAKGAQLSCTPIGMKGFQFLNRIKAKIVSHVTQMGDTPHIEKLIGAIKVQLDAYENGEIDAVYLAYTKFINTMKQEPVIEKLLPLSSEHLEQTAADSKEYGWDYLYEPDPQSVVDELLKRYVEALIYQAVAENMASEQSARMVAMKAASDNAKNVIGELQLVYNKTRQAAITKELSEIVGGAAAV